MLSIKHNMAAMNANRQLNMVAESTSKSAEKLSSGYKINRAADDAAGLAISENFLFFYAADLYDRHDISVKGSAVLVTHNQ